MKSKESYFAYYFFGFVAIVMIYIALFVSLLAPLTAHASESSNGVSSPYKYEFYIYSHANTRYKMVLASDYPCVKAYNYGRDNYKGFTYLKGNTYNGTSFWTLNSSGSAISITPYCVSEQVLEDGVWVEISSYSYSDKKTVHDTLYSTAYAYTDLKGSGLKCLYYTTDDPIYDESTDKVTINEVGKDNIASYLSTGKLTEIPSNTKAYALTEIVKFPVSKYRYSVSKGYYWETYGDVGIKLNNLSIDENGVITWDEPFIKDSVLYAGVSVFFDKGPNYSSTQINMYPLSFPLSNSIKVTMPTGFPLNSCTVKLYPFAYTTSGEFIGADKIYSVNLDVDKDYMNVEYPTALFSVSSPNTITGGIEVGGDDDFGSDNSNNNGSPDFSGVTSVIGGDIESNTDKYISENGVHQEDIPTPKLVFTGNGYTFYVSNASDEYNIEIQGRWYSVDDIEIYRDGLTWKYRYSTILKNGLSSWLKYTDKVASRGTHNLSQYGASSFANLLRLYPISNRNYYGSSNLISDYFSGYNDASTALKETLLPYPVSIYNGCEVYVRFYTTDSDGNIKYGKWCHWYDALANESGSTGSQWDDKDNMFQESQSSSGLSDSQKDDVESSGDSKNNDNDVQTTINTGTSSWETESAEKLWSTVKSFTVMLGDFPLLFAQVFSFMPTWIISLIAVGIGALVILRFLGR